MSRLTKNFTSAELTATSTGFANVPDKVVLVRLEELAQTILQPVRDRWGRIRVNSGYRSDAVNRAVGGSFHSQHRLGQAADIVPLDADILEVFRWIRDESGIEYGQLILEKRGGITWIHIALPTLFRSREAFLMVDGRRVIS